MRALCWWRRYKYRQESMIPALPVTSDMREAKTDAGRRGAWPCGCAQPLGSDAPQRAPWPVPTFRAFTTEGMVTFTILTRTKSAQLFVLSFIVPSLCVELSAKKITHSETRLFPSYINVRILYFTLRQNDVLIICSRN